jgi:hypothetical protein
VEKRRGLSLGLGGLALLALAMFHDALFAAGASVLGAANGDMGLQFLPWRDFGFAELARGNLALWNPHIYSGAPFFGGMQSALLYPPNWLYLVLPLPLATNWTIVLNVWLLGAFVFLWALRRGLHPFAAFVSGALGMYCAPHFLHVAAGHLSGLAAMPWIPLVFLAIDGWLDARKPAWCLLGMLAVAMQILAGHPQYVFFTALIAAVYSLVRLTEPVARRPAAAAGLAAFYVGGAALAAVQLFAGMQAAGETVRGKALPYAFAAMVGFPPENLVTFVVPGFFGDMANHPYWGRWILWEANAFVGVLGFGLAAYGLTARQVRGKSALVAAAALSVLLALGDSTPLFRLLYDWVPLFDRFRGAGKFILLTALVLVLFAGYGLDRILRERSVAPAPLLIGAALAAALLAASAAVRSVDWSALMQAIHATGQSYLDAQRYAEPGFVLAGQAFASLGLLLAGITAVVGVALAFWTGREPRAAFVLGALAVAEIFAFARMHRPTFDPARIALPELREVLAADPGEYRILNFPYPNAAMSLRAYDIWGYDPGVTRRYGEFIQWSTGADPAAATSYVSFTRFHALLAMLRLKYLVVRERGELKIVEGATPALGRLELVGAYRVGARPEEILRAMGEPSFDPRREVILEREPRPAPRAAPAPGRAAIVREGTDFIEISAELAAPSILLITDAWAPGWRATALNGSAQASYELMPANYALRAVPLDRGRHRLRVEYAPSGFRVGVLVSILAWLAWMAGVAVAWRNPDKARHA